MDSCYIHNTFSKSLSCTSFAVLSVYDTIRTCMCLNCYSFGVVDIWQCIMTYPVPSFPQRELNIYILTYQNIKM